MRDPNNSFSPCKKRGKSSGKKFLCNTLLCPFSDTGCSSAAHSPVLTLLYCICTFGTKCHCSSICSDCMQAASNGHIQLSE